jgi:hypothetical protein
MCIKDARPPPVSCQFLRETIGIHGVQPSMAQFAKQDPMAFNLLLAHAEDCAECRQRVEQSFPNGFSSLASQRQLEERLQQANAALNQANAEDGSADSASESGSGGKPRGGDGR